MLRRRAYGPCNDVCGILFPSGDVPHDGGGSDSPDRDSSLRISRQVEDDGAWNYGGDCDNRMEDGEANRPDRYVHNLLHGNGPTLFNKVNTKYNRDGGYCGECWRDSVGIIKCGICKDEMGCGPFGPCGYNIVCITCVNEMIEMKEYRTACSWSTVVGT